MAIKPKEIMTKAVMQVGRSIITGEHNFAIAANSDDTEYIPTVKRIIKSIQLELIELGLSHLEAGECSNELREFAKCLFLDYWMQNMDEFEDKTEVWHEGSKEFDSIYYYYE